MADVAQQQTVVCSRAAIVAVVLYLSTPPETTQNIHSCAQKWKRRAGLSQAVVGEDMSN
jgi:hypothetical protein